MTIKQGSLNLIWRSIKDQIVQPVPQEMQFCEFHCPYQRCKREATGSCEFIPRQNVVFIRPAPAMARPQWAMRGIEGSSVSPLQAS